MEKWPLIFYYMKRKHPLPLGENIKALRKQRGMTQEELAAKIQCTQETVVYYEKNKKRPSADKIPLLAQALGVTVNDLFGKSTSENAIKVRSTKLMKKFEQIEALPEGDKRTISKMLDAFLSQKKAA